MSNNYLPLTQHVKKLVKNSWKTFQTLYVVDGIYPSKRCILKNFKLKTMCCNYEMYQNHRDCNALSVTEIFVDSINKNLKIVYKNVPCLCHSCYTKTPWVMFSVVVWWIYTLWFTYDLLKIFNEKHQTEIKDFKATLLWLFKPFAEIFQIIMLRQGLII